ncbi:MAG: formamidopyrimidine-DNA glycosylase [Gemmatimonadota bacterium]|nr:MAG: formamidopyrimidine-DNA glycosylase [Gemmatimonadota bacterium]
MPELPDIELYLHALRTRVQGAVLEHIRISQPFLLRSVDPPLEAMFGRRVEGLSRLGKRIVTSLEQDYHLVLHLMIAGRLRWKDRGAPVSPRTGLATFEFSTGNLVLTEAGKKRRASLYAVEGRSSLAEHDPGGIDPLQCTVSEFGERLKLENHTVKRALCDPTLFSGIGNAYSDEILHAARMSPFKLTRETNDAEVADLFDVVRETLAAWVSRLKEEAGERFPAKITAFRPDMAVHGKYGQSCVACGSVVQRVVYAQNETNYCPVCQTGGRLLRDRALSRLLKSDWPRTPEELEEKRPGSGPSPPVDRSEVPTP